MKKSILGLFLGMTALWQCKSSEQKQSFSCYEMNGGRLELREDSFNLDMGSSGYSYGRFKQKNDSLILFSSYIPDSIRFVKAEHVSYNRADSTVLFLKTSRNIGLSIRHVVLHGVASSDTLQFTGAANVDYIKIPKKVYSTFKVLQYHKHEVPKIAHSEIRPLPISDTVYISYDYAEDILNYRFFNQESIKIPKQLCPPSK